MAPLEAGHRARLTGEEHAQGGRPAAAPGRIRLLGGLRERVPPQRPLAPRDAAAGARPLRGLPERRRLRPGRARCSRGCARPWFAVVSLEAPHPPYDAPASGVARADPAGLVLRGNVPAGGAAEARARRGALGLLRPHRGDRPRHRRADGRPAAATRSSPSHPSTATCTAPTGSSARDGPTRRASGCRCSCGCQAGPAGTTGRSPSLDLPAMTAGWAGGRRPAAADRGGRPQARISMPSVVRLPDQCDRVWAGVRTPARKLVLNEDRLAVALLRPRAGSPRAHEPRRRPLPRGARSPGCRAAVSGDRRRDLGLRRTGAGWRPRSRASSRASRCSRPSRRRGRSRGRPASRWP